jgi:hypothetical protein
VQRLVVAALAAALVLAGAGCGSSRRASVSAYFRKVDDVQHQLVLPIAAANLAYKQFGKAASSAEERRALARAGQTVRKVRARIAAIVPPKEARPIHRDLLRLMDAEIGFADNVLRLARYTPQFAAVLTQAGQDGARLRVRLKTRSKAVQAAAFGDYADALDRDVARLGKLSPPAVAAPAHSAEVGTLAKTAQLSHRLRDALASGNRAALTGLINRLANVSSNALRLRLHAAQVRAVKAFNGRLLAMNRLTARIQRERQALERKL